MEASKQCVVALSFAVSSLVFAQSTVNLTVNVAQNRHAISPLIYGVNYASQVQLADLNSPLNRRGGNPTTRYNWLLNADNRGADWFFESIGYPSLNPGQDADDFIAETKAAGAAPMITIPLIGWVAKLGPNRDKLASFSVAKYGPQTATDYWMPDAGNGVSTSPGNPPITGNDPNDASVLVDSTYQRNWVDHLVSKWGRGSVGGVKYYLMDNESSIWFATHRDVHPVGPTMDEIYNDIVDYGGKVKQADPTALIVGPEEWGWGGYLSSGYDEQWAAAHNWQGHPDRDAHNGMDYMPWLLQQLHQKEAQTGIRYLDVFSLHFYPQDGSTNNDVSQAAQEQRNRSTRSLWDPNYVDQSWINAVVQLIPRMQNWVSTYYPGLKCAITEYNWGVEDHINGATTQADVLGIFGKYGLDMATRWTTPDASTPTYKAMKMYRNYDGHNSGFGNIGISDVGDNNPDLLSSFAAVRTSDGAVTIMVINKVNVDTSVNITVNSFSNAGVAQVWTLTSSNAITRGHGVVFTGHTFSATVPGQSVNLFIVPQTSRPSSRPS